MPVLTLEYLLPSQWVPVIAPIHYVRYSSITCSPQRVAQKPNPYVTLHFQDWYGVASLRYRNRAEITVFMC